MAFDLVLFIGKDQKYTFGNFFSRVLLPVILKMYRSLLTLWGMHFKAAMADKEYESPKKTSASLNSSNFPFLIQTCTHLTL